MYLKTEGLVLRVSPFQEADAMLSVLTRGHGLLSVRARGLRWAKSPLKGACQLLTYAEFTVGEAHGFSSITEATAIEMFPELRTDIVLLSLASYFAQLAEVLSQEDAASPALLPLIPAKQRPTAAADWMTTDALIACPDPNCGARFRISRTGLRRFRHGECTVVPLPAKTGKHP